MGDRCPNCCAAAVHECMLLYQRNITITTNHLKLKLNMHFATAIVKLLFTNRNTKKTINNIEPIVLLLFKVYRELNRITTSIHRHQTPPRYRHVIHGIAPHVSLHLSASRPLRPNLTTSIKPEVHNVAQRRRRRTEPRPQGIRTQNFVPIGLAVPKICSRTDRQTQRQTG